MKEYSIKFTQISNHAPTMVNYSRLKMKKFDMGISNLVVNKCWSSMLIPSMDISRLMLHIEQIEEQKVKQVIRDLKKVRTEEGNFSTKRFEVQYKPRLQRRFSRQVPPNAPRVKKSKVPTPKT